MGTGQLRPLLVLRQAIRGLGIGAGVHQDQARDPAGVRQGQPHAGHPTHGQTDVVEAVQAQLAGQRDEIGCQVLQGERRVAALGSAVAPEVHPDHPEVSGCQQGGGLSREHVAVEEQRVSEHHGKAGAFVVVVQPAAGEGHLSHGRAALGEHA